MSLAIRPQNGNHFWIFSIGATVLLHCLLLGVGFQQSHGTLLDLIAHGAQAENNPPPLEEIVEVELAPAPEPTVCPPLPEAAPEFIKPVEMPKVAEVPKPVVPAPPLPEPEPRPRVQAVPVASVKKTQGVAKTKASSPSVGTGVGDPNFAPSNFVIGNRDFPKPPYPSEARVRRYQGVVVLAIRVVNGEVADVSIQSSSGYGILDATASHWVQTRWKFPKNLTRSLSQRMSFVLAS